MTKLKNIFYISIASLFLTACGGGGGGNSTPPPPPPVNLAPNANAGVDQTVDEGVTVNLTGTATDSDGTVSTYAWTQVSGTAVTLTNANMQNASFVAPSTASQTSIALVLRLTVTDDDGATGFSDITVTVNTTNQAPVASAGVDQTVNEQTTVPLDASGSTDADGMISTYAWSQVSGPNVSLVNADAAAASFVAPSLSTTQTIGLSVLVTDNRGASSASTVSVTVNPDPALNTAPTANAGVDVTTSSAQTSSLDGSASVDNDGSIASYAWTQTAGAAIALTGANTATPGFTAPTVTADTIYTFELIVTDNEGLTATDTVDVLVTPMPTMVTISGKATYDNVPHNSATNGLDYTNITQDPIRGAVVELIQGATVIEAKSTDLNGDYSFDVNLNSGAYFVRVKSESILDEAAKWDVKVVDNTTLDPVTNQQTVYALDGSNFDVTTSDVNRPRMNAASGWDGTAYTGNRAGAPFHILDRIMDGMLKIRAVDPDVEFPVLEVNWSPNNSATGDGSLAAIRRGEIRTSFQSNRSATSQEFAGQQLFILGAANSDTDEYDGHVVIHEWGHYFESALSRTDTTAGLHAGDDRLDMRLAFGEGFGNAWSGIITDDSFYRDSSNVNQSGGFSINVESNSATNAGWFNEGSTASILYDIYDSQNDGADSISLGLKPIYDVMVGQQKNTEAFTSIFSFITYLKDENPTAVSDINSVLMAQGINGDGIYGIGETNSAGANPSNKVLPVYTELAVNGPGKEACSTDDFDTAGVSNDLTVDSGVKIGVFRYLNFTIPVTDSYRFLISAPTATADPAMRVFVDSNSFFLIDDFADGASENAVLNLTAGNYRATVFEYDNTTEDNSLIQTGSSDECFIVQIVTP